MLYLCGKEREEKMPILQPVISWQDVRQYAEKFSWRDRMSGLTTVGYNPPERAVELKRVPFHVRYVTGEGRLEQGYVVSLKVNRRKHMRMVQFVESHAIRWVRDYLIIEIDGARVRTH